MELVNVVCLFWGAKYSIDYVNKLYSMVKRNLTVPYQFICYTNHPSLNFSEGIIRKGLPFNQYEGWFNKLTLFSNEADLKGNNLYLDLDVVILENIDELATFGRDDTFGIINDFKPSIVYNSSIMKFNNITAEHIWKSFKSDETNMLRNHGDQEIISHYMKESPHLKIMPDEWTFSYKWSDRKQPRIYNPNYERMPGKVAVFHGKPNPHESRESWVLHNWK